jgi:hypothetical protein
VDEGVLHRRIGSAKIMYDQLTDLAGLAGRPNMTIQVVPAEVGAHVGLQVRQSARNPRRRTPPELVRHAVSHLDHATGMPTRW